MSGLIEAQSILTIHGADEDDPDLTVAAPIERNAHCIVGLRISEPGYADAGVDLTALEVHLLITVLQEALDRG